MTELKYKGGFGSTPARHIHFSYQPPSGWKRLQGVSGNSSLNQKNMLQLNDEPYFKPRTDRVAAIRFIIVSGTAIQQGLMEALIKLITPQPRLVDER